MIDGETVFSDYKTPTQATIELAAAESKPEPAPESKRREPKRQEPPEPPANSAPAEPIDSEPIEPAAPEPAAVEPPPENEESAPQHTRPVRTWADATGKHEIEASLVSVNGDTVRLRKTDGTIAEVPLERLSPDDREYIKSLFRH